MSAAPELPQSIRDADAQVERNQELVDHLVRQARANERSYVGGATSAERALRLVPCDLSAEHPPHDYIVNPLVPRGEVTLLGGHGGAGKSILALALAAHVAAGKSWNGHWCAQGRVLIASLEDSAELVNFRLRKIVEAYKLPAVAVAENIVVLDGSEGVGTLAFEARDFTGERLSETAGMQELRDAAAGATLVVVDNASDAFDANENHRRMVRSFIRLLKQVARENDAGLILLAHVDKSAARHGAAGNSYSGSTAWHNSVRSRLALSTSDGSVELAHEKAQFSRPADLARLRWTETGVLVPSTLAGSVSSESDAQGAADADGVLDAIRAAAAQGIPVPTGRTGPSTAQKTLETFEQLPRGLRGLAGRERFWSAVGRLVREGRASSEAYRNAARQQKTRFVVVESTSDSSGCSRYSSPTPPANCSSAGCSSAPVCDSSKTVAELEQTVAPRFEGDL